VNLYLGRVQASLAAATLLFSQKPIGLVGFRG
jgi:hypothetical protein